MRCIHTYVRSHWLTVFANPRIFSGFILALIFANTVVLAIQGPNNELSESTNKLFNAFDLVVTVLFTIEMILRIIGLGFVRGPRTYLKDAWNVRVSQPISQLQASHMAFVRRYLTLS